MLKSLALPIATMTLLGACNGKPLTFAPMPLVAKRFYAENFQDKPFDTGAISVISTEHGDLHTFDLRPCGAGSVCGSRQGQVVNTPDYYVVANAYAGRTFYIAPGGSGWVKRDGALYDIAWN